MAGLHLVTGDAPAALLARLDEDLAVTPVSPFEDDVIIVQSLGMERWVRQQLARRRGCAASIALPFPAAYCRALAERLRNDSQMAGIGALDEGFSEAALTWRVFELLNDNSVRMDPACAPLRRYLETSDDRARFGLARSITARFDEYRLYRPDMLLGWETGALQTATEAEQWQAVLWQRLTRASHGRVRPMHFARWLTTTVERLEQVATPPEGLPSRLAVFGVSTLPPLFVRLLAAVARFVPVHVYVLSPGDAGWQTQAYVPATGSALAVRLGTAAKELLQDLVALSAHVPGSSVQHLARPYQFPSTLLQRLQADACHPETAGDPWVLPPDDRSVTVHECHAPLRELEVLRDTLLDAFAADPTLRPHDVLVMVPDVELYAPLAESVFGNEHDGLPRLPFRVADRTLVREAAPARALRQCLELVTSRCTASEMLNLLLIPPVRRAAGIPGAQLDRLVAWVQQSGIRWGESGTARAAEYDLPAVDDHSWRQGLDRLLAGYATGSVETLVHGVRPLAGDTTGDTALLGAFVQWVDRVFSWRVDARQARTLAEWRLHLRTLCSWLLEGESPEEEAAIESLLGTIGELHQVATHAGQTAVSFEVMRDWLLGVVDEHEQSSGFLTGGMTLCAMKPMRAIPHRVIAMLGLSDDAFPRRQRRAAFDLIGLTPTRGDRDARADDRQLMLDTMLCAGSRLVLSYVARSQVDNRELAPSIVIAELLEHIDARCDSAGKISPRQTVVWRHRLQPFSSAYFGAPVEKANSEDKKSAPDTRLFSFDGRMAAAVRAAQDRSDAAPFLRILPDVPTPVRNRAASNNGSERERISIADLLEAWRNPARWYARRVLALDVSSGADAVEDVEPMTVGALRKTRLQQTMLDCALASAPLDAAFRQYVAAGGELPPAHLGLAWYDRLQDELGPLLRRVRDVATQDPISVQLFGPDWEVHGTLTGQLDGGQWRVRAARLKASDRLQAWILHVVRAAQMGDGTTWLHATDKSVRLDPLPDAATQLDVLVQGYRAINAMPVPFFADSAWRYREAAQRGDVDRLALQRAFLDPGDFGPAGEAHDPWVSLLWRGWQPFEVCWEPFALWSEAFWHGYTESAL
ncbi:MAG: exodeoxyribonuclease V subunit gamma [Gemmatimonadaceae bacterium]|nr:exodeoxyribonuclease V subunit gamma [Gemmatimonadaceae bacterium]